MDPLFFAIFAVGLVAGLINVIVGSGSSIMVPALVMFGLPPHAAIATNRFAMVFNNGSAAVQYYRHGQLDVKAALIFSAFAAFGAVLGAIVVLKTTPKVLTGIIAAILFAEAVFVLIGRSWLGLTARAFELTSRNFAIGAVAGFAIGFYGGFLGMAITTMLMFVFVAFFAMSYIQSAALSKVLTLVISFAASGIFILSAQVEWKVAAVLAVAYLIGAFLGVRSAIGMGDRRIGILFATVATALSASLLIKLA
jgi:uncharacterized membrane protein YfcA